VLRAVVLTACLLALAAAPARASRTVYPDSAGNLHVFVVGGDGRLYHDASTGRGAWRGFESLGGNLAPSERVAVGRNADGRLDVFARGSDNALWHISESSPGGGWSAWTSLGGQLTGAPDVAINTNGTLEVFVRGPGNALWHTWQYAAGGTWAPWTSRGGVITTNPAVIPYSTGALVVWALGSNNGAYHIWQNTPHGPWSGWANDGGVFTSAPAPSLNEDGRQQAYAIGQDNQLYSRWQTELNGGWSDNWAQMGGVTLMGDLSAVRDSSGRLHLFGLGSDNALWHIRQNVPNGNWSSWRSLGGQFSGSPVIVKDRLDPHDGALHVIAQGTNGTFYESYESGPSLTDWTPFASLGRAEAAGSPPLNGGPAPAGTLRRLVVTVGFTYSARRRTTRLKSLTVKDMPRGGTVSARCARGCSRTSLVKSNVTSSKVSLSALVKKPLKVGTKITITATAPGTIGAVKTLTIRSHRAPAVKTRCLPPGATRPAAC
jgi:hypothetical protein